MANSNAPSVVKDLSNRKMTITKYFDAEPELVWLTWTEPELLDQWWAPKPYQAQTKSIDFRDGGYWLFAMVSPTNDKHWCRIDYSNIQTHKTFEAVNGFCDENGVKNTLHPVTKWKVNFAKDNGGTSVAVELSSPKDGELEKLIEMGFEEGFSMALGNLDQYLKAQFKIRQQLKTTTASRVSSYLNFPGNTEEAFKFYRKVFQSEFSGKGLQRFGDIPAEQGHPAVPDVIRKMVLHVELPILGGHILMGTDAPKEMGFTLNHGNNMHINLEPETRVETKRLFDALAEGGTVSMELKDMFFGSYFGELKDKYGINWMFTCTEKIN